MSVFESNDLSPSVLLRRPSGVLPQLLRRADLGARLAVFRLGSFARREFSTIDQAFLVWGAVTIVIFGMAQFSTLSWMSQAVIDAALTGAGIAVTSGLTWAIATQARLCWVIFLWAGLMTAGTVITVYGIFYSSVLILANLCLLWLGLCAVGYGWMAAGMRSRCFTSASLVHFGAIALLSYLPSWQFFNSGLVIASTLVFFSFVTWDMQD